MPLSLRNLDVRTKCNMWTTMVLVAAARTYLQICLAKVSFREFHNALANNRTRHYPWPSENEPILVGDLNQKRHVCKYLLVQGFSVGVTCSLWFQRVFTRTAD